MARVRRFGRGGPLLGLAVIGAFYLVAFVSPTANFLRLSFLTDLGFTRLGPPTTANYSAVIADPYLHELFIRTIELSAVTAIGTVVFAYPIAFTIARSRGFVSTALFLLAIASVFTNHTVGALGMVVLLADEGPVSEALIHLGFGGLHVSYTFAAVAISQIVIVSPFAILALIPVCDAVPPALADAAYGLGATRWRTFWTVIFPQTRTPTVLITLLIFSFSTGSYVVPSLLGGGHVRVLPLEIQQQTVELLNYPLGAALAVTIIATVFLVVGLSLAVFKPGAVYRAGG